MNKSQYREKHQHSFILVLLGLAFPLCFYHLLTGNMISLYKHTVYALLFLIPIVVLGFDLLICNYKRVFRNSCWAVLFLITLFIGVYQLKQIQQAYPNTPTIVAFLKEHSSTDTRILSENPYLFREAFYPRLALAQFSETGWLDNNQDNIYEEQDAIDAVWDGKFDFIYLDGLTTPERSQYLKEKIISHRYEKVVEIPYHTSNVMTRNTNGAMEIYMKRKD